MTSCLECCRPSLYVWMELDSKRNIIVSMVAGTLFFMGWWFVIDAHAKYPSEMQNTYYLLGVFATFSLIMVNCVVNGEDTYEMELLGQSRNARVFLFVGFVMGFCTIISASWILFENFIAAGDKHNWLGVSLFLQNIFIFIASLTYKFGIRQEI